MGGAEKAASVGGSAGPFRTARAKAYANIALAKYWGKSDTKLNLPAVPSISVTLAPLATFTEVRFDSRLAEDRVSLDGAVAGEKEKRRVVELLDRVRSRAGIDAFARVESRNEFPTAAGLASSASGFAALAAGASASAGLSLSDAELSAMARQSSASAARSIFGGFSELPAGLMGDAALAAHSLAPASHWDLRVVVAVVHKGPKAVGSTEGMERSRTTSPLYDAWVAGSESLAAEVREAIAARDLAKLGPAMEQSTMAFHSCALSARPPILYWQPATLAVLRAVFAARETQGLAVWNTMDAGPHVKLVCEAQTAPKLKALLQGIPEVVSTIEACPGEGVSVTFPETE